MNYGMKFTSTSAFSCVAIVTGGAQLARMAGRARFALETLTCQPVAPIGCAHFVITTAVTRLTETAGQ